MKFILGFKTPDVLDGLNLELDEEMEEAKEFAKKFVEYGEYLRVEFDTEKKTVTVLECKK